MLYPDTVNYHLIKACNYKCVFCFDTFEDVLQPDRGRQPFHKLVIRELAKRFKRINFVGGEPLLVPHLPTLLAFAKSLGMRTSVVTNASWLTADWLSSCENHLDCVGISMDSQDTQVLESLGRAPHKGSSLTLTEYEDRMFLVKGAGLQLKLNIVVNRMNWQEDFRPLLRRVRPARVKFMQLLPMAGQNDGRISDLVISANEYLSCWSRHSELEQEGIEVPFEPNELMLSSYAMVDPWGRFFDTSSSIHLYSKPLLEVGIDKAWCAVNYSEVAYRRRGGDWNRNPDATESLA